MSSIFETCNRGYNILELLVSFAKTETGSDY